MKAYVLHVCVCLQVSRRRSFDNKVKDFQLKWTFVKLKLSLLLSLIRHLASSSSCVYIDSPPHKANIYYMHMLWLYHGYLYNNWKKTEERSKSLYWKCNMHYLFVFCCSVYYVLFLFFIFNFTWESLFLVLILFLLLLF